MSWPCRKIKTQLMVQALDRLVGDASALILLHEKNDETQKVYLSTRNLPDAKALMASYINIRDLMTFDRLILPFTGAWIYWYRLLKINWRAQ